MNFYRISLFVSGVLAQDAGERTLVERKKAEVVAEF